ncbi:hypothetical protein BGZ94_009233 [Podila epigama]|nr:hypothetical protein BGZ94_009233 [Podila epigama]
MEYTDTNACKTKIAEEVFLANCEHIRFLTLSTSDYVNAPQITQLKGLSLQLFGECLNEHIQLLNTNPGLSSLVLSKSYGYRSLQADDVMALLKPMTGLRSLTFSHYLHLEPVVLKNVLDSNQHLESLHTTSTSQNPDFDDWGIYPSIKDLKFEWNSKMPTWIFHLLQHCPNVEALHIRVSHLDRYTSRPPPVTLLTQALQEHGRKVKALTFISSGSMKLSTLNYISVVQATNNLVRLHLTLNDDFSMAMYDALLRGSAHSLEVLRLDLYGKLATVAAIVNAGRILSSCPELRHLHIMFENYPGYTNKVNKALSQPWICTKLKTLALGPTESKSFPRCTRLCEGKISKSTCSVETACASDVEKQGWKIHNRFNIWDFVDMTVLSKK